MIRTVLIANRGEIALRVARTCRELGLRTVAVYSAADQDSAVVRFADRAVRIGPPDARRSYRNAAAIVEAARQSGADAIHPGYGFLSEDAGFAEICEDHGITFIGPPASVMAALADKTAARAAAVAAGLPVLLGSGSEVSSRADAVRAAREIGYPLIVKAAAGGGGRGMSVVRDPAGLDAAYESTRATAQALFGDGRVYLERYLESARHVEVQILCDTHGNAVHLGERDCSVQRRHQKLIEETPSPALPSGLRDRLGEAAVRAARAMGYVGAGTFEFLVDDAGDFAFLEVNCRIQVEHPVTEMVTGMDLVAEQLRIADGTPLAVRQADIAFRGAAIECRVNAEDPERNFAPTPGRLREFVAPGGPFTRVDTHAYPGWVVTPDYDSLLAKVVVWAPDRNAAIARMDRALGEFRVRGDGVHTTIGFLREVIAHPSFRAGRHRTSLVDNLRAS